MASSCSMNCFHIGMIFFAMILSSSSASRHLSDASTSTQSDTMSFKYHKGPLLRGRYSINLIWYGAFKPAQRAIIADFVTSLQISPSQREAQPSVATWWGSVAKLYPQPADHKPSASSPLSVSLGRQIIDESYSVGKSLTLEQVEALASKGGVNSVNVVLTADDVAVEEFCTSSCGGHGSTAATAARSRTPYVWVGNSVKQCPGWCAWPFHQPVYGPQSPALVAPNNDVGMDGMVINLAGLLAGTATNPFGNGYYQGPQEAPLEAATACPGVYGKGAYPGYPGQLLVDAASGASYNTNGVNGRRFLLPALFDPSTSTCSTLV